jgi:hypothetical protein
MRTAESEKKKKAKQRGTVEKEQMAVLQLLLVVVSLCGTFHLEPPCGYD